MPFKTGSKDVTFASEGTIGAATPSKALLIGADDGTNIRALLVEDSTNINLRMALFDGANASPLGAGNSIVTIADITSTVTNTQLASNSAKEVIIKNTGSNTVRIGDTNNTATRGYPLGAGATIVFSVNNSNLLFHRTESSTTTISVSVIK
ncbi:hypothetical protein LCGC14_2511880 [marine sediment metagenome]|uniref:Uncharacterized protein n=1 Tax=marine sediment metagenome TaxID=412755 RepID=A0A0F9AZK8_9ZZZZ